jgi:hypothetical protein
MSKIWIADGADWPFSEFLYRGVGKDMPGLVERRSEMF